MAASIPTIAVVNLNKSKHASSRSTTMYERLSEKMVKWCRYCGTLVSNNWRPGPWLDPDSGAPMKATLCNKHGCDYRGYGHSNHSPRLFIRQYVSEPLRERRIPICQEYCYSCRKNSSSASNPLVMCAGCPISMHKSCCSSVPARPTINTIWYHSPECRRSEATGRVPVDDSKKRVTMPFMVNNEIGSSGISFADSSNSLTVPLTNCELLKSNQSTAVRPMRARSTTPHSRRHTDDKGFLNGMSKSVKRTPRPSRAQSPSLPIHMGDMQRGQSLPPQPALERISRVIDPGLLICTDDDGVFDFRYYNQDTHPDPTSLSENELQLASLYLPTFWEVPSLEPYSSEGQLCVDDEELANTRDATYERLHCIAESLEKRKMYPMSSAVGDKVIALQSIGQGKRKRTACDVVLPPANISSQTRSRGKLIMKGKAQV